jgi:mannose-6-phosphate isomerase-like protein (cupin superfamily)
MIKKPWGTYEVLLDESDHKVKRIRIKPNERFSLQYHNEREEHWTIVEGIGILTQHGVESEMRPGEYVFIPRGGIHRLQAGKNGVTFIEIQRGICYEEDIVRLEDDYGRIEKDK